MAWTTAQARLALRRFEEFNILSVEEPVATIQEMARIRSTTTIGFSAHEANLQEAVRLGHPTPSSCSSGCSAASAGR